MKDGQISVDLDLEEASHIRCGLQLDLHIVDCDNVRPSGQSRHAHDSRRRDCHSAAPPSLLSRFLNMGEEGGAAK